MEIKFRCEHCEQEYWQDSFNIAVILYGIFFLIGNDSGYAGITCPRCLKTITFEGKINQIEFLKNNVSDLIDFGNNQFYLNPRYHSSVNYFPKHIQGHKDIDIPFWNEALPMNLNTLKMQINSYIAEENLHENYFCTYAFDDEPPMGSFLSIGWFKKDWIDDLIRIENEKSLRIFPRYVPQNSVYDDIERFCWENHIYLNYLEDQEDRAKAQIKELEEIAKQNNEDFQENLDANRGIITPGIIEYMKRQFVDYSKERNFSISTDFLSILIADPPPLGILFRNDPLKSFWKTMHPFRDKQIPKTIINFDFTQFKKPQRGPSHKKMADIIRADFTKESTQEYLSILSSRFIFEYIEKAQKIDFSYGAVWGLKEKYLKLLHDSITSPRKRNDILNKVPKAERREVKKAEEQFPNVKIISNDSKINHIKIELPKLAKFKETDTDILLLGETGTGKELFAKAFHESSRRDDGNFVAVNCASIPENLFESQFFGHEKGAFTDARERHSGYFEQADGGTIFLDEIGELHLNNQTRFLRVLQNREIQPVGGKSKEVDVKIVYATNQDLDQMIENGSFRRDLYQRISAFQFPIPPLKDRKDDIPLLVYHFIDKYDTELKNNPKLKPIRVTDNCMALLKKSQWEGNVRELENVIKKIIVLRLIHKNREDITPSDLPPYISQPVDYKKTTPKPKKGNKRKPSREELIQFKEDGILQKEIAEKFGRNPSTVSKWYKDLNEGT